MLTEDELEDLYRASLYTMCYLFAYEYSESIEKLHADGRWDTWVQGTQERYGPTLNKLIRILMSKVVLAERVESSYREDFGSAVYATVGSLTKGSFWDIASEAGVTVEASSWNLAYLDTGLLEYLTAVTGVNITGTVLDDSEYMWDEWGLEAWDWMR